MALAVKVSIPWDRANEQIPLTIRLVTDQGENVADPQGNPISITSPMEVGRPPGLTRGTLLDACIALNFAGLPLELGGYAWLLEVDGGLKSHVPFRVLP
jgi:hypothetical protein